MATFYVPNHNVDEEAHPIAPASVTRGPPTYEPMETTAGGTDSRRNSVSRSGLAPIVVPGTAANSNYSQPPLVTDPNAKSNLLATAPQQPKQQVIIQHPATQAQMIKRPPPPARLTRRSTWHWSTGRKCCCGLCIVFLLILITVGVLIYFLVRTPSVEYKSAQLICLNNDYITCARTFVTIEVVITVTNPNIIGATINADLGLFKQDNTFLGPGYINDTYVNKRATTDMTAVFNITSDRAYDILYTLYVPDIQGHTHSVTLHVDGTVYVHVGALRPSLQFQRDFTIPPQQISNLAQAAGLPTSVSGGVTAIEGVSGISSVNDIPGGSTVSGIVSSVSGLLGGGSSSSSSDSNDTTTTPPPPPPPSDTSSSSTGPAPLSLISPHISHTFQRQPSRPMNPTHFAKALVVVGAPASPTRLRFEILAKAYQQRQKRKQQKEHQLYKEMAQLKRRLRMKNQ